MAAASNRPPLALKPAERSRLLLAHDLHATSELLALVPIRQTEAARLRAVLLQEVDRLWPTPTTGAAGRNATRPIKR